MSRFVVTEFDPPTATVNASNPLGTSRFVRADGEFDAAPCLQQISARTARDSAWSGSLMSLQWPVPIDDHWASSGGGRTWVSAEDSSSAAAIALDSVSEAIFLVDRNRQIRHSNRQAQELVREHEDLTAVGGRLSATSDSVCQLLIEQIRAVTMREVKPETRIMVVGSFDMRNRLLLKIKSAAVPSLAVVIVTAYDQRREIVCDQLRAIFGLTRAEVALAMEMLIGQSLREAAQNLGVTYNTARCQLYRVFEKAGVRRQHELVLTLSRFVG
jgi:DNA-binding CsgD family transcriptional regulator